MSFFKEFKEDLSQAVNELMPGENLPEDELTEDSDVQVNTLEDELDVASELSKLDGLLEKVSQNVEMETAAEAEEIPELDIPVEAKKSFFEEEVIPEPESTEEPEEIIPEPDIIVEPEIAAEPEEEILMEPEVAVEPEVTVEPDIIVEPEEIVEEPKEEPKPEAVEKLILSKGKRNKLKEETIMSNKQEKVEVEKVQDEVINEIGKTAGVNSAEVTDETAVITTGMKIKGDISSTGSLDIQGEIEGDVTCNGKLTVTGIVKGNSSTAEFFADSAKIEGEVTSTGTVKIGLGSVVIGNVKATSAVIAGAIKGDIDVQGPVVVDTSAVVVGNIKSRSVQINNGAVIEGFCSQCYADINVDNLFGEKKGK